MIHAFYPIVPKLHNGCMYGMCGTVRRLFLDAAQLRKTSREIPRLPFTSVFPFSIDAITFNGETRD